jgi:hypothetical protein
MWSGSPQPSVGIQWSRAGIGQTKSFTSPCPRNPSSLLSFLAALLFTASHEALWWWWRQQRGVPAPPWACSSTRAYARGWRRHHWAASWWCPKAEVGCVERWWQAPAVSSDSGALLHAHEIQGPRGWCHQWQDRRKVASSYLLGLRFLRIGNLGKNSGNWFLRVSNSKFPSF